MQNSPTARVAIAGLGAIGRVVAEHVQNELPGYEVTAATSGREEPAREFLVVSAPGACYVPAGELADHADIVIEAAPASVFEEIARPVVEAGKTLIPFSAGRLLQHWELVELAGRTGARIHVPSGAFVGLDAVQGLAQGRVDTVRLITRKPATSLVKAPFVQEKGIDLAGLGEPVQLFKGSVADAIVGFPQNLNVAVALSLAGVGPEQTGIEVWADPDLEFNTHRILAEGDAAQLDLTIRNIPSENPATGLLTPLSVIALLRKLDAPLRIGT